MAGDASEADELERGLREAFETLMPLVDDGRVTVREGYRVVISPRTPFPPFCGVWVDDPAQDAQIARRACRGGGRGRGGRCAVLRAGDRGSVSDLPAAAAELGLTQRQQVVGMVAAPSDIGKAPETAVSVRRIERAEDLPLTLDVAAAGFGAPGEAVAVLYTPRLLSAPGIAFYLAEVDGEPVATGVGCILDGLVGVYSVATPPEHRRRGYGSAVVAQIVADGFDTGAQLAYLQASAMGASVYAKLGFRRVLVWDWLDEARTGLTSRRHSGRTSVRPMNATISRSSGDAPRRCTRQPCLRAASEGAPARRPCGIRIDPADVTERESGAALLEQRAHARAESGQVGARDRAFDGEGERLRRCGGHCEKDPATGENSSQIQHVR